MCLIILAYQQHAEYPLLVAANRDEYHRRPTAPAEFWSQSPQVLAGRDLEAGGTWLGTTRDGRFAALTNHRGLATSRAGAPSRGELTLDFLRSSLSARAYLDDLVPRAQRYAGFNLLIGDASGLYYFSNRDSGVRRLEPGVWGLSNAVLNTPWPKLQMGRRQLTQMLRQPDIDTDALQSVVSDRGTADAAELPDTGVGAEAERLLSAQFILSEDYGTRATTSLMMARGGNTHFLERRFNSRGELEGETRTEFNQTI